MNFGKEKAPCKRRGHRMLMNGFLFISRERGKEKKGIFCLFTVLFMSGMHIDGNAETLYFTDSPIVYSIHTSFRVLDPGNASLREKVDLSSTISRTGKSSLDGRPVTFPCVK